jgi:hypothetical protein
MNLDPFVLRGDACLATLLGRNLQTGTALLIVYGGLACVIVASLAYALAPGL